ncbi:MAG: bifunctional methylenetetrahydrofolate dehydrogenase/methenyltetrahydrofolate cyclohydrolase, partial [Firmicutes bacterium]|nr:bifunctional methylenetetrahydrofolate dehydrogenase/methenyltetrahydrofolate cyclohydrolase [Candidatus Colimorpha enterica]
MKIIDGKAISQQIREEIKNEIAEKGLTPGLAVVLAG